MQSSSPASAFLTWDMDAARNPLLAILSTVVAHLRKNIRMLPFIIKYTKTLNSNFDLISNETILKCFQENLSRDGVDRIFIKNNSTLKYENDFFAIRPGLNWNIWVGICGGRIEIFEKQNKRVVTYLFNTSRFFIIGLIAGIAFSLFLKTILAGLFAFSVLGLLNWLISILRHQGNFSDLLNEVLRNNKNGLQHHV